MERSITGFQKLDDVIYIIAVYAYIIFMVVWAIYDGDGVTSSIFMGGLLAIPAVLGYKIGRQHERRSRKDHDRSGND